MSEYRSYERATAGRKARFWSLALPLIAFLLGIIAMGWLLTRWHSAATFLGIQSPPDRPVIAAPAPAPAPSADATLMTAASGKSQTLLLDPEMRRQVNRLEQKITELENQSQEAAGSVDRAEGLLVAFAARRALDRGVSLGYIEGLLRQRFSRTQRQAVATIITASRQPVTLEELQEGLQEAGPDLVGAPKNQDWWSAFKAQLGGLIVVRKADTPSTMPAERLRRATRRLENGQVDVALAEVLRMPGCENAQQWIGEARRYVAARRALDTIETAALLEPRTAARQ